MGLEDTNWEKTFNTLIDSAVWNRKSAYAPYSKYLVGACVLARNPARNPNEDAVDYFDGCNIENASYGLTVCAERSAIFHAVTNGYKEILAVVCATEDGKGHSCGACLQVMAEFGDNDMIIKSVDQKGNIISTCTLGDLLPLAFRLREKEKENE